jgi:hypothetical protein
MAKYRTLTHEQYKDFCMTIILESHTEHLKEWMPEDRIKKLAEAGKILQDVILETIKELSQESGRKLKKNIGDVELFCLPKQDAKKMIKERRAETTIRITSDAFLVLLEHALEKCKAPCGRNYKQCILRKVAREVAAPEWNPDAKGYCPYEQRLEVDPALIKKP